jgi:hypothetical protein
LASPLVTPLTFTLAKYSREPLGSAFMVFPPSDQLAGQTSPCASCEGILIREIFFYNRQTYSELEGFDETDGLVHGATHGEVIDSDLSVLRLFEDGPEGHGEYEPENALGVNQEQAPKRDALLLEKHTVVARDR